MGYSFLRHLVLFYVDSNIVAEGSFMADLMSDEIPDLPLDPIEPTMPTVAPVKVDIHSFKYIGGLFYHQISF